MTTPPAPDALRGRGSPDRGRVGGLQALRAQDLQREATRARLHEEIDILLTVFAMTSPDEAVTRRGLRRKMDRVTRRLRALRVDE